MNNQQVTVILNIWKRDYVKEQVESLLAQTHKPTQIWILQSGDYVETQYLKSMDPSIEILHSTINLKYFGRFSFAQFVDTDYIYIVDDDNIPSANWIEYCIQKSEHHNSIISSAGRIIPKNNFYPENLENIDSAFIGDVSPNFYHNYCKEDTLVDFGCNSWFLKAEWIKYIWMIHPYTFETGEDIHLSAVLKTELNVKTIVPQQVDSLINGNLKRYYGSDDHASWTKPGFLEKRAEILSYHIKSRGWTPIMW